MKARTILPSFAVSLFILSAVFSPLSAFASTSVDAFSAIEQAKSRLIECYNATLIAEMAGANASLLLDNLSEAGFLLSEAELAFDRGDFDAAVLRADQSRAELESFLETADSLKAQAEQDRFKDFMVNIVGSIIGAVIVAVGGIGAWIFLTSKYGKPGSAGL